LIERKAVRVVSSVPAFHWANRQEKVKKIKRPWRLGLLPLRTREAHIFFFFWKDLQEHYYVI
jgi:hypothetical protein